MKIIINILNVYFHNIIICKIIISKIKISKTIYIDKIKIKNININYNSWIGVQKVRKKVSSKIKP